MYNFVGHKFRVVLTALKSRYRQDCIPLWRLWGKFSFSCLLLHLEATCILDWWSTFTSNQQRQGLSHITSLILSIFLLLFTLTYKDIVSTLGHPDNSRQTPHLKILNSVHLLSPFLCPGICNMDMFGAILVPATDRYEKVINNMNIFYIFFGCLFMLPH